MTASSATSAAMCDCAFSFAVHASSSCVHEAELRTRRRRSPTPDFAASPALTAVPPHVASHHTLIPGRRQLAFKQTAKPRFFRPVPVDDNAKPKAKRTAKKAKAGAGAFRAHPGVAQVFCSSMLRALRTAVAAYPDKRLKITVDAGLNPALSACGLIPARSHSLEAQHTAPP